MTKSRLPTSDEIAELVAFLPRLYAEGFEPVDRWMGGAQDANGVYTLPWPEYNQVVMFIWWPLWDINRAAWAVFFVLFVANTALNLREHVGDG